MKTPRFDQLFSGLALLREHVVGRLIFWGIRRRFRQVFLDVDPLATYLESDLFPDLREDRVTQISIRPDAGDGRLHFDTGANRSEPIPYDAPRFVEELTSHGIQRIELDTTLESGQIAEGILLLLRARSAITHAEPSDAAYTGWDPRKVASTLLGRTGYKKFCAILRLDRELGSFSVEYSYCPLFFSRLVQKYSDSARRFADHRAFFRLAPRAALLTLMLFAIPAAFLAWNPVMSLAGTVFVGCVCAAAVWLGIHTIGSIQYDKEHYESVRKTYFDQIRHLARYPEVNPNPVLELSMDGEILYTNPAGQRLLAHVGKLSGEANCLLPDGRVELVCQSARSQEHQYDFEHTVGSRILQYTVSAFPDDKTVIVSGRDVTQLKHVENELRSLNHNLDATVQERTQELALTQDVTILCLAGLAETRDPETGRHLDRTRHYVRALAEHLREHTRFSEHLSEQAIHRAFKSAPLHDIGKVGVPDAVLLKPGRLTPEEFEQIKVHPILGGDALRIAEGQLGFNSFLTMAKEIAYYHHERWDGRGYPYGLSGDDIPWSARLMALADVYDALTSKRPYKEPWTHDQARAEIVKNRGAQFDPDVVDAFIAVEHKFIEFARTYAEPDDSDTV